MAILFGYAVALVLVTKDRYAWALLVFLITLILHGLSEMRD